MNFSLPPLSSILKKEYVIHLLILAVYFFMMEYGLGSTPLAQSRVLIRMNFMVVPLIFYINIFWLIPRFLKHKKWVKYSVYSTLTILFFELLRASYFYFGSAHSSEESFIGLFFNIFNLLGATSLGFVLSFAYRFTKDWILNLALIEKLKAEKANMELAYLKSQVDPHFLFNTLNSLYAMALEEKSTRTADGIAQLGTLMRYNLHDAQSEFISLQKEIDYLQKYIALQKLRLTDINKLEVTLNITPETLDDVTIAPMLLLPIIENVFKYGVSQIQETSISISFEYKDGKFLLNTSNSLPNQSIKQTSSGVGLRNVEQRLSLLYKNKYTFSYSEKNGEFLTNLELELN